MRQALPLARHRSSQTATGLECNCTSSARAVTATEGFTFHPSCRGRRTSVIKAVRFHYCSFGLEMAHRVLCILAHFCSVPQDSHISYSSLVACGPLRLWLAYVLYLCILLQASGLVFIFFRLDKGWSWLGFFCFPTGLSWLICFFASAELFWVWLGSTGFDVTWQALVGAVPFSYRFWVDIRSLCGRLYLIWLDWIALAFHCTHCVFTWLDRYVLPFCSRDSMCNSEESS